MKKKCTQAMALLTGRKDEKGGEARSAFLTAGTKEIMRDVQDS